MSTSEPMVLPESGDPRLRREIPTGYAIAATGVCRSFGSVQALRGLDLTVPYGSVTGLVGPNGAGKTTLLLILATLLTPDSGHVWVAGADPVTEPATVRAATGWMPDVLGVYDQLTAAEYLEFFARAYRMGRDAAWARAAELLDTVHLSEYADSPVHVLSRGQKQRLALARALVHRPRVLLLDEPAAGLDPRSRVELRDLLHELAAEGAAVLISSHVLMELEELVDHVVFVSAGRTVGERELAELTSAVRSTWRVRATDPEVLAEALAERGTAATATTPAGTDLPEMTEDEAADLLAWLVARPVRVVAFGPVGSRLETAYLSLTQERR